MHGLRMRQNEAGQSAGYTSLDPYGEAAAWYVERVSVSEWRWAAWSNWSSVTRGGLPEVSGLVTSEASAISMAGRAARSMNPLMSFQVAVPHRLAFDGAVAASHLSP